MPNIDQDLRRIMNARYGRDVRQSIHDAISDINDVADEAESVAITSQQSAKANADKSKSYAVGATGTRTGEDTDNSEYYKKLSQSFAKGGSGVRTGEATDNAEYFMGKAEDYCERAEDAYDNINTAISMAEFTVDFATGELMYTNESTYNFEINPTTGNLEWEVIA